MKQIEILQDDANQRLDKFLLKMFPDLSRSLMYKAIRNKKIKVNRKRCTYDQVLNKGDIVLLFLPPQFLNEKQRESNFISNQLDVIYEDENILIVNKPVGLLSQSDTSQIQDTLVSRIQGYLYEKNEYDPNNAHSFAPGICNRLDRNTRGLVIAAKNANASRIINEAIAQRRIHKYYKAYVSGHLEDKNFVIKKYMYKNKTKALVSDYPKDGYKIAYMEGNVLMQDKMNTWVEIELHTGRFHQIRALMSSISHPLVGDKKYGYKGKNMNIQLIAYKLRFDQLDLSLPIHEFVIKD